MAGIRKLVYLPTFNAHSLLLFYWESNHSWSLRDYSTPGHVRTWYQRDEPNVSVSSIKQATKVFEDAPTHRTDDLTFWWSFIAEKNKEHQIS